ncbi:MAG: SHOCT domain-containing protein [Thermaerobacter sp.]|nr:SHOCT domain-containing protein [Thermaerobacter sp.]
MFPLLWLLSVVLSYIIAKAKNRNPLWWAGWAMIGNVVALLVLVVKEPLPPHGFLRPRPLPGRTSRRAIPSEPLAMIQQLSELRDKGVLTDPEFQLKKAEILDRI